MHCTCAHSFVSVSEFESKELLNSEDDYIPSASADSLNRPTARILGRGEWRTIPVLSVRIVPDRTRRIRVRILSSAARRLRLRVRGLLLLRLPFAGQFERSSDRPRNEGSRSSTTFAVQGDGAGGRPRARDPSQREAKTLSSRTESPCLSLFMQERSINRRGNAVVVRWEGRRGRRRDRSN